MRRSTRTRSGWWRLRRGGELGAYLEFYCVREAENRTLFWNYLRCLTLCLMERTYEYGVGLMLKFRDDIAVLYRTGLRFTLR